MNFIETRGETRKRKNREYLKNLRKQKRTTVRITRDHRAKHAGLPWHILEINEGFEKDIEKYADWPQIIDPELSKEFLKEFRDTVSFNELRELPCAVCSKLNNYKHYKEIPIKNINLNLLKAPNELIASSFEINFHYNDPYIDNINSNIKLDQARFIYPLNHQNTNNDNLTNNSLVLRICDICYRYLQKNITPPLSLANNMWIGTTPPCLQDLTIPEQLTISPGYLCINLIQITNKKHTHHKLKGHIITLPQNPSSLAKVLPLPMFRLCDYLKVVFVGKGTPAKQYLKKILQVRRSKVATALQWLFEHNKLFKDHFKLDKNILNSLPEGEIPESLALTTTVIDFNAQNIEHFTGYTHDPLEQYSETDESENDDINMNNKHKTNNSFIKNNTIGSACNFRSSGVLHVNDVPVSEEELTLNSLQKLVEKSNSQYKTNTITETSQTKIICIPHSQTPLNEYEDPTLFPAAFPVLYLYGIGGHKGYSQQVSFKEYINHLMRHHDPKFRQHRSFPFVTFNILQRREVSSESYSLTKYSNFERSANLINTLKPNDIKLAIEQEPIKSL